MIWSIVPDQSKRLQLSLSASIILFVIGFFGQLNVLFFLSFFLLLFAYLPEWYMKVMQNHLLIKNEKNRYNMFIGDEEHIPFTIINQSYFPILGATCSFYLDEYVSYTGAENKPKSYSFSFSIKAKSELTVILPIQGQLRGLAKMSNIHVNFYDPFRLKANHFIYQPFYRTDFLVYPKQEGVYGLKNGMTREEGEFSRNYSLYKDPTALSGTRAYHPGDPLRAIHWKATAKTGGLQTKIFEPAVGMTWTFVLLFDPSFYSELRREDLERMLSRTAFLAQYAKQQHIRFELMSNIKMTGKERIFHIAPDDSMTQLAKVMEILSIIQLHQFKSKIDDALNEMDRKLSYPRQLFFIGQVKIEPEHYFYKKWSRLGHRFYHVNTHPTESYVVSWSKEASHG